LARRISVGLDIGSSAVRAAEVTSEGGRGQVTRFGQVGLPAGAVVEGEVRDQAAVADAVKRLWSQGGFSAREVVVGISSQRSMVRQVEMPKLGRSELRSALRYEIGDLLPIPVDQAVFDFAELGPGGPKGDGGETTRVLLVVAQSDIVLQTMRTVKRAGLKVKAIDSSPLALLRGVPPREDGGIEAVVSVGAHLVVVAVREGSVPRFIRTVVRADQSYANAARQTVDAGRTGGSVARANGDSPLDRVDPAVDEVRDSIEYFLSHDRSSQLLSVALCGGGAADPAVRDRMSSVLRVPVRPALVGQSYDARTLNLSEAKLEEAAAKWTTAVGLAAWGTGDFPALSLVPPEVNRRHQYHRAMAGVGVGVAVVAGGLGYLSVQREASVNSVSTEVAAQEAQAAQVQSDIDKLQAAVSLRRTFLDRRQLAVTALQGDVDWVSLVHRIEANIPSGVSVVSITLTEGGQASGVSAPAPRPASSSVPASSPVSEVGQVSMSLTATGGPPMVAEFVRHMWAVRGLYGLWVSGATSGQGTTAGQTAFTSTAFVTSAALSDRAAHLPAVAP